MIPHRAYCNKMQAPSRVKAGRYTYTHTFSSQIAFYCCGSWVQTFGSVNSGLMMISSLKLIATFHLNNFYTISDIIKFLRISSQDFFYRIIFIFISFNTMLQIHWDYDVSPCRWLNLSCACNKSFFVDLSQFLSSSRTDNTSKNRSWRYLISNK